VVQASKAEALLAVDLYNSTGERRSLEAFVVHMHMAWLYLLHAAFSRDGVDYRYWDQAHRHIVRVDGEPKTWELERCVRQRWMQANDPVRRNLEFFIGLRNRIEHRYRDAIGVAVAGHAQAMILNYENELISQFGREEGLADRLRFPVFLSSLTPSGVEAVKRLRASLPARATQYITDFNEALDETVAADPRFEFRIHLVPQLGPKTEADLAVNFLQLDALDAETRTFMEQLGKTGLVAAKVRHEPVQNLDWHRPIEVVRLVSAQIAGFTMHDHTMAWRRDHVRPGRGGPDPAATDPRYCLYDLAHGDYIYSNAWVAKLIGDARTPLASSPAPVRDDAAEVIRGAAPSVSLA
jgi:hypothetical protein